MHSNGMRDTVSNSKTDPHELKRKGGRGATVSMEMGGCKSKIET